MFLNTDHFTLGQGESFALTNSCLYLKLKHNRFLRITIDDWQGVGWNGFKSAFWHEAIKIVISAF